MGHDILIFLLVVSSALFVCTIIGILFPKFGHAVFGWHHVGKTTGFDGARLRGKCDICDKDCMQDSQGNWL